MSRTATWVSFAFPCSTAPSRILSASLSSCVPYERVVTLIGQSLPGEGRGRGRSNWVITTSPRTSAEPLATVKGVIAGRAVRFTKTFRTETAAQRDSDAWTSTGDWSGEVVEGRAPGKGTEPQPEREREGGTDHYEAHTARDGSPVGYRGQQRQAGLRADAGPPDQLQVPGHLRAGSPPGRRQPGPHGAGREAIHGRDRLPADSARQGVRWPPSGARRGRRPLGNLPVQPAAHHGPGTRHGDDRLRPNPGDGASVCRMR